MADSFSVLRDVEGTPSCIDKDTSETEKFCRIFNRVFDCFNTRHPYESLQKVNDDLKPYDDPNDARLQVYTSLSHTHTFLFNTPLSHSLSLISVCAKCYKLVCLFVCLLLKIT